jgi:hypothetical protein
MCSQASQAQHRVGPLDLRIGDQPPPELRWHAVGGITTKPFKAKTEEITDDREIVLVEPSRIACAPVVKLSHIDPHNRLATVLKRRMYQLAGRIKRQPLGCSLTSSESAAQ